MPSSVRQTSAPAPGLLVRGSVRGPVRAHLPSTRNARLATSVWLPWFVGVFSLLTIAGATIVFGGHVDRGVAVPAPVLDLQQAATVAAAQQVRNAMQAGLQDLEQLASGLATVADATALSVQVKSFATRYRRYRSAYVLDETRKVSASAGATPHPMHVPAGAKQPGMTDAIDVDNTPVVFQYVPFRRADGHPATAVAEYQLARLGFALNTVKPSTAWLVNAKGEVVASTVGFVAFQQLTQGRLRGAAAASYDKAGVSVSHSGVDAGEILAFAPVRGGAKTSAVPQWGLVTSRSITAVVLPQTQARRQALLVGLAVTVVTVVAFGWMYLMWLRPLRRLVADTSRIAQGDLTIPVQIRRHDEIGLVAAAVERIRVGLVRDITARSQPDHTQMLRIVPRQGR